MQTPPPAADRSHDDTVARLRDELRVAREQLRARTVELDVLHSVASGIGRSLNFEELFRLLLENVDSAVSNDIAAGLLLDGERADLFLLGERAELPAEAMSRVCEAAARFAGRTVRPDDVTVRTIGQRTDGGPVTLVAPPDGQTPAPPASGPPAGDAATGDVVTGNVETGNAEARPSSAGPAIGSSFIVPIMQRETCLGFLFVGSEAEDRYGADEVRLLYTLAGGAAEVVSRLQDVLAREKERQDTLLTYLPAGVLLLDCEGRVEVVNPAGRRFFGPLTGGVEIGDRVTRVGERTLADAAEQGHFDVAARSDGGQQQIVHVNIVPLRQSESESWLAVAEDVTDVREAVTRRDGFLAMLAHELRNPLAAVSTAGSLLSGGLDLEDVRDDATQIIVRQSAHMTRLVDDLLELARYLHGKIRLKTEPLDLAEVLTESAESVRPAARQKGQSLSVKAAAGTLPAEGDRVRLAQAVTNVLQNAVKYTPENGSVRLKFRKVDNAEGPGHAEVVITDTGIGLTAGQTQQIFEPFEQTQQGLDRSEGGLGLGLPLARRLVELHGGQITARSRGPSCGSTFTIFLPLSGSGAEARPSDASRAGDGGEPVLLVEDNDDLRRLLSAVLKSKGRSIVEGDSGPDGLEKFRRHTPPVAVCDLGLPGFDGYELARQIRSEFGEKPVLVALSGYGREEDRRRSREVGFDHHLLKPPDIDELIRCFHKPR